MLFTTFKILLIGLFFGFIFFAQKQHTAYRMNVILHELNTVAPCSKALYLDSNIIRLLYQMQHFQHRAPKIFKSIVTKCDEFMQIIGECEADPQLFASYYDKLVDSRKDILNEIHSMTFNVEVPEFDHQLHQIMSAMRYYLNYNIESVRKSHFKLVESTRYTTHHNPVYKQNQEPHDLSQHSRLIHSRFF